MKDSRFSSTIILINSQSFSRDEADNFMQKLCKRKNGACGIGITRPCHVFRLADTDYRQKDVNKAAGQFFKAKIDDSETQACTGRMREESFSGSSEKRKNTFFRKTA